MGIHGPVQHFCRPEDVGNRFTQATSRCRHALSPAVCCLTLACPRKSGNLPSVHGVCERRAIGAVDLAARGSRRAGSSDGLARSGHGTVSAIRCTPAPIASDGSVESLPANALSPISSPTDLRNCPLSLMRTPGTTFVHYCLLEAHRDDRARQACRQRPSISHLRAVTMPLSGGPRTRQTSDVARAWRRCSSDSRPPTAMKSGTGTANGRRSGLLRPAMASERPSTPLR